jgi:hypothetical protein
MKPKTPARIILMIAVLAGVETSAHAAKEERPTQFLMAKIGYAAVKTAGLRDKANITEAVSFGPIANPVALIGRLQAARRR